MYTIISATNRIGSNTLKVAKEYQNFLSEKGVDAKILSLENFNSFSKDEAFLKIENDFLIPTKKFIFIMPEYNGSFPGIFKLMMDISDIGKCWNHKQVLLVGVANGRAGNLRGIDIMTNVCHYMKMHVHPNKIPLSLISSELSEEKFVKTETINTIKLQIEQFINYKLCED